MQAQIISQLINPLQTTNMDKPKNPYMNIELSTDTESESENETFEQNQNQNKIVHVQSAKSKKYQQFNDIEAKILELIDEKNFSELQSEFSNFQNLLDKNTAFTNKYGMPKSFLRTLKKLQNYFFEENTEIENEIKDKGDLKGVKIVKQRIKKKYQELKNLIQQQVEQGQIDENEVSEYEEIDMNNRKETKKTDDDDFNFAKRLTLSPEERRKFWLVKKKDITKSKKDKKSNDNEERKKRVNLDKVFKEEKDEFYNFPLRRLPKQLFAINQQKNSQNLDDLDKNIRFLEATIERLEEIQKSKNYESLEESKVKSRYIESIFLYIELMLFNFQQQGVMTNDQFEEIYDLLKVLLKKLNNLQTIKPFNYNRGEETQFVANELIKYFNNYILKTQEEIQLALKLNLPFSKEFVQILQSQSSFFLEFLDSVVEFYEQNIQDTNLKIKFINQIKIAQLEQIYFISDDFLLNCRQLSEYFEETSVSELVETLQMEINKNNKNEKIQTKTNLYYCFNQCINNKNLDETFEILKNLQNNKKLRADNYQLALFNRAIGVLGIGYFKTGQYNKCKGILSSLCNSGKAIQYFYQYDPFKETILEQENPLEIFPFYMHLNLQEIDNIFLISCVISETHKTVNYQQNLKKSPINKRFMKFLQNYQQNMFINSQNNNQDCIYTCYRSLLTADYQRAFDSLKNISLIKEQEDLYKKILNQLKLESLLCYLEFLKNEEVFEINIEDLSLMFQIEKDDLKQKLQDKIKNKELSGSYNENEQLLEINNTASDVFQTEQENQFLEKLIKANEYIKQYTSIQDQDDKDNQKMLQELNQICQKNFKSQKKSFQFGYNFADVYVYN